MLNVRSLMSLPHGSSSGGRPGFPGRYPGALSNNSGEFDELINYILPSVIKKTEID